MPKHERTLLEVQIDLANRYYYAITAPRPSAVQNHDRLGRGASRKGAPRAQEPRPGPGSSPGAASVRGSALSMSPPTDGEAGQPAVFRSHASNTGDASRRAPPTGGASDSSRDERGDRAGACRCSLDPRTTSASGPRPTDALMVGAEDHPLTDLEAPGRGPFRYLALAGRRIGTDVGTYQR